MKNIFVLICALFIVIAALNADYDPTSGTGGGTVFAESNNTYSVGTTQFLSHAVVSNNLSVFQSVGIYTNAVSTIGLNFRPPPGGASTGILYRSDSTGPFLQFENNSGTLLFQISSVGSISRFAGLSGTLLDNDELNLVLSGGIAVIKNNSATANSDLSINGGTGATSGVRVLGSGAQLASFMTNAITIGTNAVVQRVIIGPNTSSRGQGIVVSGINTITNSLLQAFSGTYGGAPTNIVFPIVYASSPFVTVTTTTPNGTALGNDTAWVTNITTTGFTVGYRNGAGADSSATITFNGIALGRQ